MVADPTRLPRISRKRKVAYTAIIFVALLVLCEVAVRARVWVRHGFSVGSVDSLFVHSNEYDLIMPRPGYESKGSTTWIKINSLGFRGDEIAVTKPPNTIRIACLGASTTFCAEVSSNLATWPQRLGQELARKYPDIKFEVINAGVSGRMASDSLKTLKRRVLPLRPDIVLVYHANNDIMLDSRAIAQERGLIARGVNHQPPGPIGILAKYSLLVDLVYKNVWIASSRVEQEDATGKLGGIPHEMPDRFIDIYRQIHAELAERDILLALSTFQVKYRRDQDRSQQLRNADVSFWNAPWMTIDDLLDAVDLYNRAIRDFAHEHDIPVMADTGFIPADDGHFTDAMHLTDRGCDLLALKFVDLFEQAKLVEEVLERRKTSNVGGHATESAG